MKQLPKTISIFPLSNFIFFPQTTVPLNIFEPRYIQMVDDAMKGDRIIGMVQPKKSNQTIPILYNIGCAGKIISFNETEDGRPVTSLNAPKFHAVTALVLSKSSFTTVCHFSTRYSKSVHCNAFSHPSINLPSALVVSGSFSRCANDFT